jgi:hypothetical protein
MLLLIARPFSIPRFHTYALQSLLQAWFFAHWTVDGCVVRRKPQVERFIAILLSDYLVYGEVSFRPHCIKEEALADLDSSQLLSGLQILQPISLRFSVC